MLYVSIGEVSDDGWIDADRFKIDIQGQPCNHKSTSTSNEEGKWKSEIQLAFERHRRISRESTDSIARTAADRVARHYLVSDTEGSEAPPEREIRSNRDESVY